MNKTELIAAVAEKSGISKKDAEKAVAAALSTITEALKAGEKVQLVGFGVFEVRERPAHKGHNPMTGAEIEIAASKAPAFKAGKALKEALNKLFGNIKTRTIRFAFLLSRGALKRFFPCKRLKFHIIRNAETEGAVLAQKAPAVKDHINGDGSLIRQQADDFAVRAHPMAQVDLSRRGSRNGSYRIADPSDTHRAGTFNPGICFVNKACLPIIDYIIPFVCFAQDLKLLTFFKRCKYLPCGSGGLIAEVEFPARSANCKLHASI